MADRYWRGGTGTWNTSSTTNWSDTSGGTGGFSVPTAADNVIFDQAGTYTVTMTGALACLSITVSAGTVTFATGTAPTLAISGSMSLVAGTVWSSTGAITFNSTTNQTITTNAVTINGAITFNGVGGNWSLGSALTLGATLTTTLTNGTITLNGFTLTTGIFSSNNTNVRSIAFGSNNIVLAHTTAATNVLDMANINNFSYTGTGGFTTAMGVTRTFTSGTTSSPGSVLFNGTTQYGSITTAASGPLDLATGAGNWTVEGWIFLTNTTADRVMFWKGGTTGSINPSYAFWIQAGGTGQWIVGNGAAGGAFQNLSGTFLASTWYHFALVRNGNVLTAYVNGVAQTPVTMTFTMSNTANNLLTIGSSAADGGTRFLAGNISNFRVVKGVAVYTGNFTPPINTLTPSQSSGTNISAVTYSQTSLLLNTPNNANFLLDSSINAYTVTNVATATAAATTPVTTVNGSVLTPPKLALTSGASIPTFTTGSFFDTLAFTGSTSVPAVSTVYLKNLTLAAGVSYANLTAVMAGTGSVDTATNTTLTNLTVNNVSGTTTLASATTLTATSTFTLTSGTLDLGGFGLACGIFSSSVTNTRAIAFGSNNINLTHTTAATTVLSMAILTGFTYTGTGGFTVVAMSATKTFTCGTTGGTSANAPNLTFTTGASVATLTTASWFNKLDYGTTSFTQAASTLNVNSITLSTTGTYTALILNLRASGTVTYNGKTTAAITLLDGSPTIADTITCTTFTVNGGTFNFTSGTINPSTSFVVTSGGFTLNGGTLGAVPTFTHTAGTVQFNASYALTATGTYTFTAGTLSINDNITLSTGIFSSSNANTRTINFGLTTSPGYIALTHTTAATVVLSMAIVTGLTVNALGKFPLVGQQYITQNAGGFVSNTTVTKTFTCGTTGGNSANAPCLTVLGTGATQLPTFTTGSWFGDLNVLSLTTMTIAATTLNVNSYISQGYYYSLNTTSMNLNMVGSGVFAGGGGDTNNTFGILGAVTINHSGTTSMLYGWIPATTVAFTSGTLECRYWVNGPYTGYGSFKLTGAFTQTGGTWYGNAIYIESCTTYTVNGATVSFDSGSITATTSMVLTSGSFTFNGGTTSAIPLFTHTAGTVRIKNSQTVTLAATGTYTFTAGSLILEDAAVLNTGIFSSSGTGVRSITFGTTSTYPAFINLTHTTAATTVLSMATVTNFTYTASYNLAINAGASGFKSDMPATQTFVFGTTGGSISNAPNLRINGSSTPTITTGSWFNILDFTSAQTFTLPATSLNLNSLIPAYGYNTVVLTGLTANMRGPGFLLATGASSIGPLVINNSGTTQLVSAFFAPTYGAGTFYCTTLTITAGNFDGGVQKFTGSCTAGVLTTTGSPTLVPGTNLYDNRSVPDGYSGTVISGSGNTWVLSDPTTSFASKDLWVGGSETYATPASLTCSGAVTWTGGTLTNFGSTSIYVYGNGKSSIPWTCTTFTLNGPTFNHTLQNGGTINPSTSFVLTSGSYTYNGGVLGAVPAFTHTAGTATFNYNYSLTTTGTYTLTAGTLTLAPSVTLATGIFSSSGAGTRAIGFGASITSGSVALNGVDQYLTVPSSTALTLGTGDFTIEAWINPITVAGGVNQFTIIKLGNLQIYVSDGVLYYTDVNVNVGGGTVAINQWIHVAVTRIGTLVTAYINGVPYISTTSSVNFAAATTLIGNNNAGALAWGYISNLRVVKGVSVYTIAAFTPPTTALTAVTGTQLLVDAASSGAYLTDGSTNNFTLTPTGSVTYNASTPVSSGGSLYFDQTTVSYLTLPSSSAFNITGDFTVEAWIKPTTILTGVNGILDTRVAGQSATPWVFYVDGTGLLGFFTGSYYKSTSIIKTNVWTHVAVVRSGVTLTFFINGVQNGSTYIGPYAISPGTTSALIGTKDFSINAQFRTIDYITNLRFVNGTALYTPNAGSFVPPTGQLASTQSANTNGNPSSAITGTQTSLLLNTVYGTSFLTDSSTYNATVTNNGTAISSARNPFAGYVNLTHTTAATVVLNMAAAGGFTYTGNGGFSVAEMTNTRTLSVANTSGGSATTAPNLYFTTGASVATLTTGSWYNNLDFSTTSFTLGTTSLNINGDLTLSSSGTYTGLTASILGTGTVTTNGKTIVALTIGSATLAGTATLAGALTLSGALTLTQGSLTCSTYNVQSATFASTGALTRTMTGSGTYTITGAGATAFSNASTGITITGLIISMTAATAKTFAGGGGSYPTLNQGGAGALTISGNNSFADLTATTRPSTITFTVSTTQTFTDFTLSGISGSLVTINSSLAGTQANLSKTSGTVSVGYLNIRDSNATGGAGWYAGTTSTNVSNNTGWIFTAPSNFNAGGRFFAFF